ncbi:hypothetical protein JCM11641_007163 [Rhodosporidiobolus odoratus]
MICLDGSAWSNVRFDSPDKNPFFEGRSGVLPNLVRIHLFEQVVDLATLEPFLHLQRLVCSNSTLTASSDVCFPALEELSLISNPRSGLAGRIPKDVHHAQPYMHGIPREALIACPHTLMDCASFGMLFVDGDHRTYLALAQPVRLYPYAECGDATEVVWPVEDTLTRVHTLKDTIGQGGAPLLSTLILPSTLRPGTATQAATEASLPILKLLDTCTNHDIEVVFEPTPHPCYDSLISPHHWRKCKALKEKKMIGKVRTERA